MCLFFCKKSDKTSVFSVHAYSIRNITIRNVHLLSGILMSGAAFSILRNIIDTIFLEKGIELFDFAFSCGIKTHLQNFSFTIHQNLKKH